MEVTKDLSYETEGECPWHRDLPHLFKLGSRILLLRLSIILDQTLMALRIYLLYDISFLFFPTTQYMDNSPTIIPNWTSFLCGKSNPLSTFSIIHHDPHIRNTVLSHSILLKILNTLISKVHIHISKYAFLSQEYIFSWLRDSWYS